MPLPASAHPETGTPSGGGLREGANTTRNPLLLFRFAGLFLLRLADRQFLGLLFHEPPRSTRRTPFGLSPREKHPPQHRPA